MIGPLPLFGFWNKLAIYCLRFPFALIHSSPAPASSRIIKAMARGWESKSVELQQAEAQTPATSGKRPLTPEQAALQREKQGLVLNRQRVQHQLETAQNPKLREMLEKALADLDARITRMG